MTLHERSNERNGSFQKLRNVARMLFVLGVAVSSHAVAFGGSGGWEPQTFPKARGFNGVANSTAYAPASSAPSNLVAPTFRGGSGRLRSRDGTLPPLRAPQSRKDEVEDMRSRLTYRYANPKLARFVRSVSKETALRLYREASDLIDRRHLEPASYQKRVHRALRSLTLAVHNWEFQQANGLRITTSQANAFGDAVTRLATSRPVRSANDALNTLYWTMDLARRQLGMSEATVAVEFVHGSTDSLDKYSAFEPGDVARKPSASLKDHVVGIGVEIKPHDSGVLVVKPLRGGPAASAGLQPGDIIVSVNGRSLAGRKMDFVVDLIGGPEGSRMLLGIERKGEKLSPISLVRRRVKIYSVSESRMLDGDAKTGYVKLDKFAATSNEEMDKALWELHRGGMQSLIIDLRGNPGGLLTTAIALSNKFLPKGTIVSTRGRNQQDNSMENATYERTWKLPLVVLVDENSASASEIFAAAIQENGRGIVVGRTSYGKGTVQTHFPLQSVSGNLRLTTARFFSPNGRVMAGSGVTPDVIVKTSSNSDDGDSVLKRATEVVVSEESRQMAASQSRDFRGLKELQR